MKRVFGVVGIVLLPVGLVFLGLAIVLPEVKPHGLPFELVVIVACFGAIALIYGLINDADDVFERIPRWPDRTFKSSQKQEDRTDYGPSLASRPLPDQAYENGPALAAWLEQAGYTHHCYISWPETRSEKLHAFAGTLRRDVEEELEFLFGHASVFLDPNHGLNDPGTEPLFPQELCESVAFVAIVVPAYFGDERCGREWNSMQQLSDTRLSKSPLSAIKPVIFRWRGKRPDVDHKVKWINVSYEASQHGFLLCPRYGQIVQTIVKHVYDVAQGIEINSQPAACDNYIAATATSFPDYVKPKMPYPLLGGTQNE